MSESPRVLVGTLYSGENEFQASKRSLEEQTYPHWEHVVYRNLPNKEAHDRLYRTFMEKQDQFDLFLKLDADMVFRSEEGLEKIVRMFQQNPDLDHLTLAVRDWYSDSLIEGLHTFSANAAWSTGEDSRFVDPDPEVPGKTMKLNTSPAPVVDHSPDPSPIQAFRFGVHRALKVVQPSRWRLRYQQSRFQWNTLRRCWEHFERTNDRRLGLALMGAEAVFEGNARGKDYDKGETNSLFKEYKKHDVDVIRRRINNRWVKRVNAFSSVGVGRFFLGYAEYVIRVIISKLTRGSNMDKVNFRKNVGHKFRDS